MRSFCGGFIKSSLDPYPRELHSSLLLSFSGPTPTLRRHYGDEIRWYCISISIVYSTIDDRFERHDRFSYDIAYDGNLVHIGSVMNQIVFELPHCFLTLFQRTRDGPDHFLYTFSRPFH